MASNGIPLWFRCFKGQKDPDAFQTSLIIQGINYVANLFKHKKSNLIFLADRWFPHCEILNHIHSLGCTYYIRAKSNILIDINNKKINKLSDIKPYKLTSKFFDEVYITQKHFRTKLAISKYDGHNEALYILTNGNTRQAVKHYGFRFGSIETIFKNQKSNGFYLESTKTRNIHAFTSLFTLACVAILWLTILGVDYSKGKGHFKTPFKIRYSKRNGQNFKRTVSLFNTGLFFFNLAFNSPNYVLLKYNFLLYDV